MGSGGSGTLGLCLCRLVYSLDTHHVAVSQGLDMKKWWVAFVDALPRRLVLLDVGARGGLQRPWSMLRRGVYQMDRKALRKLTRPTGDDPHPAQIAVAL